MAFELARTKSLRVLTTQGPAGDLVRESQIVFNYRTDRKDCEIALTMPLRSASYAANILPGVLRQNLPEGYLMDWIVAHFSKVTRLDDMTIMSIAGRRSIGRVHCQGERSAAPNTKERLKTILTWKGTESLFEELSEQYAAISGVSGVQPKVLVPAQRDDDVIEKVSMKDSEFIVKSSGEDYPFLAENEFHCMSIAKNAELDVPNFWLSDDKKLFVVERFDLGEAGYLGFEDMTALTNRQNAEKYDGSYELIAKVIKDFAAPAYRAQSLESLFSTVALSALVRNGDAHLKNFGLLYTHPQSGDYRLSPIYDIVTTTAYLPKDVLALKLNKSKGWPLKRDLIKFGREDCDLDRPQEIIERISDAATSYRPDESSKIWEKMKPIIDHGCFEYNTPGRLHTQTRSSTPSF